MNYIKHLEGVFDLFADDDRLNATHVSLYIALFTLWNRNRFENPLSVTRADAMMISKIGSNHTYHKCLKQLDEFGYLRYYPSFNPLKGSHIHMFNFDTGSDQDVAQPSAKNDTSSTQALSHPRDKNGTGTARVLPPSLNNINYLNNKQSFRGKNQKSENGNEFLNDRIAPQPTSNKPGLEKKKSSAKRKKEEAHTTNENEIHKNKIPPAETDVKQFFQSQNYPEIEAAKFYNHYQSVGWKIGKNKSMKDWQAAARNWMLNAPAYNRTTSQSNEQTNTKGGNSHLHTKTDKNYGEPL